MTDALICTAGFGLGFVFGLICGAITTAVALVALMAEAKRRKARDA